LRGTEEKVGGGEKKDSAGAAALVSFISAVTPWNLFVWVHRVGMRADEKSVGSQARYLLAM
jgi:hypothetical protein